MLGVSRFSQDFSLCITLNGHCWKVLMMTMMMGMVNDAKDHDAPVAEDELV